MTKERKDAPAMLDAEDVWRVQDARRNDRIARGSLERGARVADGQTGGNALTGGQTEPPVPRDEARENARPDG